MFLNIPAFAVYLWRDNGYNGLEDAPHTLVQARRQASRQAGMELE